MARKRKTYTKDFKQETVKLIIEQNQSPSDVSRSLGINLSSVNRWVTQYRNDSEKAFPGNGKQNLTSEQQRIKALEAEVRQLKMEKEILKKATAFFAKEQL